MADADGRAVAARRRGTIFLDVHDVLDDAVRVNGASDFVRVVHAGGDGPSHEEERGCDGGGDEGEECAQWTYLDGPSMRDPRRADTDLCECCVGRGCADFGSSRGRPASVAGQSRRAGGRDVARIPGRGLRGAKGTGGGQT